MSAVLIFIAVLFVIGVALGAYAFFAPKREAVLAGSDELPDDASMLSEEAMWAHETGSEFAGLSESARCDFIFAVGALEDDGAHRLLLHALGDPSATVALAAAHVLARAGRIADVRAYAEENTGERSAELLQLLSLMT